MGSHVEYGSYVFEDHEVDLEIPGLRATWSEQGVPTQVSVTWILNVRIQGDNPTAIEARIAAINEAFRFPGRDLRFYTEDGTLGHSLLATNCLQGPRVVVIGFPRGDGAEYTTFRNGTIVMEAMLPPTFFGLAGGPGFLVDWSESLSLSGGWPVNVALPCISGPPVMQSPIQQTPYRAVQSGRAIGLSAWPNFAPPIFSPDLFDGNPVLNRVTPRVVANGQATIWEIQWQYQYISASPINGTPTMPPI